MKNLRYFSGDELRNLREFHTYTQSELAQKIGVNATQISRWEAGGGISRKYLIKLNEVFFLNENDINVNTEKNKIPSLEESLSFMEESIPFLKAELSDPNKRNIFLGQLVELLLSDIKLQREGLKKLEDRLSILVRLLRPEL